MVKALAVFCLAAVATLLRAAQPHPSMSQYNRAWQLIGQQRAAEGIPLLKEIIARDKQFYRAYKTLVDAYEQEKRLDDAEWYMHALIEQDPENGLASYGLGEICRRKKQYGVAAEHFTDCVRHAPETPACYIQLLESLAAYSISSV